MPQSKVSALALCIPSRECSSVLPKAGGHRSCQNKHWCGGERRKWEGTQGALQVKPEGSAVC